MNKVEFVTEQIEKRICDRVYIEGGKLPSESDFCREFAVSRLTVRSAITALAAKGLIETFKGKGSFVSAGTTNGRADIKNTGNRTDMFEFRRILETEVAGIAAQRADPKEISELRKLAIKMKNAADEGEAALYDAEFHHLLALATHNSVIIGITDMLRDDFQQMFRENIDVMGTEGSDDHLKIAASVESRNSEQARRGMKEHLNRTMHRMNLIDYTADISEK